MNQIHVIKWLKNNNPRGGKIQKEGDCSPAKVASLPTPGGSHPNTANKVREIHRPPAASKIQPKNMPPAAGGRPGRDSAAECEFS